MAKSQAAVMTAESRCGQWSKVTNDAFSCHTRYAIM
jgi:hypothetical protein